MNVTFRGPENEIITHGYGNLKKGEPKEIANKKYAYDLCATGRCDPSDDAARGEYQALRADAIDAAIKAADAIEEALKAGKKLDQINLATRHAVVIYCDRCLSEVDAKTLKEAGCPKCPPATEGKEN